MQDEQLDGRIVVKRGVCTCCKCFKTNLLDVRIETFLGPMFCLCGDCLRKFVDVCEDNIDLISEFVDIYELVCLVLGEAEKIPRFKYYGRIQR